MDKNKTEEKVDIEQPKVNKPTHRYVCEACSGVAFYGIELDDIKKSPSNCGSCGANLGIIKIENFIKL